MSWWIDNIRIITSEDASKPDTKIAELFPLDGEVTVFHYFGYASNKRNLGSWLLDNPDDWPHLQSKHRLGHTITLSGDQGIEGQYKITQLQRTRVQDIKRPKPVWKLAIELTAVNSGSF